MKRIILSFLAIAFTHLANAQVSITSLGTPYTQNFDALSNDTVFATTHAMGLTGWAIFERGTGAAADQLYRVSNGSRNNGETYSYGDSTSSDRALGSISSASNKPSFGVVFQNNTGANITGLSISYKGEEWRSGDTTAATLDSLVFEYSTTATGVNDTVATWNSISSLMFNTPNLSILTAGALNGNVSPNFTNLSGTISVLISNGNKITLRWRDINKIASDDGLAIDDLSVSFSSTGNPKPSITSTAPMDDANLVSPSLTNLTMTFDQNVVLGTGNVIIKNLTDATQQTIVASATTIAGAVVTIPGVTLLSGKQYAVNFDSTCYTSSTSANSYGIYDNTSWNFATQPNGLIDVKANNLELQMAGENAVTFDVTKNETLSLTLFDITGKVISTQIVRTQIGKNTVSLHTELLTTGAYFIRLSNSNLKGTLKFVKQ